MQDHAAVALNTTSLAFASGDDGATQCEPAAAASRPTEEELKLTESSSSSSSSSAAAASSSASATTTAPSGAVPTVVSSAPPTDTSAQQVASSVMVAVAAASQFDTTALDHHGAFDPSSMSDVATQLQAAAVAAAAASASMAASVAVGTSSISASTSADTTASSVDGNGSSAAPVNSSQHSASAAALLRCSSPLNLPSSPSLFSTSPTSNKSTVTLANLSANMLSAEAALASMNAAAEAAAAAAEAVAAAENDTMMANAAASVQSYFQNDSDSVGTFTRELREFHRSVSELEETEKQIAPASGDGAASSHPPSQHGIGNSLVQPARSSKKRKTGANASIDLQTKIRLIELAEEYQYDPRTSGRTRGENGTVVSNAKNDQMSGIRLAAQFGLNKSTVSRILKRKEEFKKAYYKDNVAGCSKHINKKSKFEKLNRLVENWFDVTREKKVAVSDTLIRDVGKRFAEELGIEDFRASNGWVRSLRNRKEHQARNMSLEALERERMKKDAEAIERMRSCFPNGAKDLAAFFKDLAIYLEKGNELLMGSTNSSSSSISSSSCNQAVINGNHLMLAPPAQPPPPPTMLAPDGPVQGIIESALSTDDTELGPDFNHEEFLKKKMIESLRSWSHELMETELAKLKKQLKPPRPTLTPSTSAASSSSTLI